MNTTSTGGFLFWVLFYLVLVLALFFLIIKVVARKNRVVLPGRTIKAMGGLPLGQNKSIQLVELGNALYLLGVGQDIQLVAKIDDPEEIAAIRAAAIDGSEGNAFRSVRDWVASLSKRSSKAQQEGSDSGFQQVFQEKMLTMTNRKKKVDEWMSEDSQTDGRFGKNE